MGASFYGELVVRYISDTSGLSKGMAETQGKVAATTKSIERSLGKTGLAMQNVGRTMTQYYTLPVVAGLGYATYAAYKYQKSMIQVQNLTGLSAQQAAKFSDEIRQASAEIGNAGGPQAAADAFYFLASSGLDAKEAMNALRVSMKASVAGMGDVQVLADVVTSAMNSYGHEAYNATQAMDILMRTIEVGKAEPTALASSLGRIMPIANQLDVSLEELGGNVAALTLGGLSSAESVTALRGTMAALVSPAKMSIDTLKTLGLTYKQVTKSIADKGLLPTLKMLWEETDHNMLLMRQIIPNIRATTGVMSLLGANYEKNLEVIERVNDSQGKLNETYKTASQTDVAKFNRALNELKSTFIEVGAVTLPVVTKLVKWLGDLVGLFNKLSPGAQKFLVWFLAISAAAMPALSVLGSFTRAIGLLIAKRAAAVASSAAEVASNAALAASNTEVAASEVLVADATASRAAASRAAAMGPKLPAAGVGMGALAIVGIGAAITAATIGAGLLINKLKEIRAAAELRATLQPEIATEQFNAAFTKAAKKSGFDKVTVDGVVYYNYTIKPQPKGGPDAAGKTLAEAVDAAGKRGTERLNQLKEDTAKLVSQVQQAAYKAGGANSIMALLGQDVETNKYRGLALRPIIKNLTNDIAALEEQRNKIARSAEIGKGRTNARQDDIAELDWWIGEQKRRLSGYKTMWGEVQEKMRIVQEMQPQWDYSKGLTGLRKQVKQYAFDIREFLGQPVKMPKIDFKTGNFKKQLGDLEQWINHVARSREIDVTVKRRRINKGIKEMEEELARVNQRIKRTGMTPELKVKKEKLEQGIKDANTRLRNLGKVKVAPTVALEHAQFDEDVQGVIDRINSIPAVVDIDITTSTSFKGGGSAWGGIFTKPKVTLVGEDGPEVIIPLTKPARAAQLMKESGLANYTEQKPLARDAGAAQPLRATGTEGPVEVHYHNHMTLPQGMVVSDLERFGSTMRPYIEHGTRLAERRRARGRAGL